MIRRLLAWALGRRLIILFDHDGEENLRIERYTPSGKSMCHRVGFGIRRVTLLPDGTVANGCYVKRWAVLADYRRDKSRGVNLAAKNCDVVVFPRRGDAA